MMLVCIATLLAVPVGIVVGVVAFVADEIETAKLYRELDIT